MFLLRARHCPGHCHLCCLVQSSESWVKYVADGESEAQDRYVPELKEVEISSNSELYFLHYMLAASLTPLVLAEVVATGGKNER